MTGILIFGPPGMGKSTLIEHLQIMLALGIVNLPSNKIAVADLEMFSTHQERIEWLRSTPYFIAAAADVTPDEAIQLEQENAEENRIFKVLLFMPQYMYEERRRIRDAKNPGKASQPRQVSERWLSLCSWDYILQASIPVSENIVHILCAWRKHLNFEDDDCPVINMAKAYEHADLYPPYL